MVEDSKVASDQQYGEGQETKVRKKSKFTLDESVLDHKLRQKLWEGLIPLKIDLDLNDIKSSQKPRSLYVSHLASYLCRSWLHVRITSIMLSKTLRLCLTNTRLKTNSKPTKRCTLSSIDCPSSGTSLSVSSLTQPSASQARKKKSHGALSSTTKKTQWYSTSTTPRRATTSTS